MPEAEIIKCHCNSCGRVTQHDLLVREEVNDSEDLGGVDFYWTYTYETLRCRGCSSVSLKEEFKDSDYNSQTNFYPPRIARPAPKWRWDLPEDMQELLEEIYAALHNDSRRLVLMGARSLIDMLAIKEIGDTGTFKEKLEGLEGKGLISSRGKEVLFAALNAGHAAAHRGYKAEYKDVEAVMDIVENLLEAKYHLDKVVEKIKKNTPQRT